MSGPLNSLLLGLTLAGCTPVGEEFGIHVDSLVARPGGGGLEIRARQEIRLSAEAREALRHGVPLRLAVDLRMVGEGGWRPVQENTFTYEIRYLPLSDHYQLSGPASEGGVLTFPRLRHVLAELADVELSLSDAGAGPGSYEVRMRTRLDRSGMPAPMQLPVLLSPRWDHDSGWVSSTVELGG